MAAYLICEGGVWQAQPDGTASCTGNVAGIQVQPMETLTMGETAALGTAAITALTIAFCFKILARQMWGR